MHRFLAAFALVSLLSGWLDAQGVRFDKRHHLDSYEEVFFSEWSDLYDLESFDELEGRSISAEKLIETQQLWREELTRVRALLEEAERDPSALFHLRLGMQLGRHPYFSRVAYERQASEGPITFYIQTTAGTRENHALSVGQRLGPALTELAREFDERYVKQGKWKRAEEHRETVVFVLASRGDFGNYAHGRNLPRLGGRYATYDTKLKIGVTVVDPFDGSLTPAITLQAAKRAIVQVLLSAHTQKKIGGRTWWEQGLGAFLATPITGGKRWPAPDALRPFVAAVQNPNTRLALVQPLGSLVASSDAFLFTAEGTRERAANRVTVFRAHQAWEAESELLVHYLHESALQSGFAKMLAGELGSTGGPQSFRACFGITEFASFERDFLAWTFDTHIERFPTEELRFAAIEATVARRRERDTKVATKETTGGVVPESEPEAEPEAAPVFDPRVLLIESPFEDESLALALDAVRRKRFDLARGMLRELGETASDDDIASLARDECKRVEAWIAMRDQWLAEKVEAEATINIDLGSGREKLTLLGRDGDTLSVRSRREPPFELRLEKLDGAPLVLAMESAFRKQGPSWMRGYLVWYAGDERWIRHLRGKDEETRALAGLLKDELPKWLRLGAALGELNDLGGYQAPFGVSLAGGLLERVRALRAEHGGVPRIAANHLRLAGFAGLALGEIFDADPGIVLHGDFERLDGDEFRLSYDFEDPASLADFIPGKPLHMRVKAYGELEGTGLSNDLTVRNGSLTGSGHAGFRHVLGLTAPFEIRYHVSWSQVGSSVGLNAPMVFVGLVNRGDERYCVAVGHYRIDVFDDSGGQIAGEDIASPLYIGAAYEYVLAHDGTRLTLSLDGFKTAEVEPHGMDWGELVLILHADLAIHIHDFEIRGRLGPEALAVSRARWIAQELKKL